MKLLWGNAYSYILCLIVLLGISVSSNAALKYEAGELSSGDKFVVISGDFEYDQDLAPFVQFIRNENPTFIVFNSAGGNPSKAMEMGHLIRTLGLGTFQPKFAECASACALAFLGGIARFAEPGAIGVHKTSFADTSRLSVEDAVSAIQHMTAETIAYITEMGADPALLQLSLQYDSDDIRYLSKSEMEKFRVTTSVAEEGQRLASPSLPARRNNEAQAESRPSDALRARPDQRFQIPIAKNGLLRHPKGSEFLRADESQSSTKITQVFNGDQILILDVGERWYKVKIRNKIGFLHHNWVKVDQFVSSRFDDRYVQIASFDNYAEAKDYIDKSALSLSIYLASNRWFAVTLPKSYPVKQAAALLRDLKTRHAVPVDAFATVGNTYVNKMCCQ